MCHLPLKSPSHLFHHPIPLGYHRALALGSLCHTSNSHLLPILHMVIYIFQCYSLKSSHPLLLHCVQKSVIYVCISFTVLHIALLTLSFYIPCVCVSCLVYLTLCDPIALQAPLSMEFSRQEYWSR